MQSTLVSWNSSRSYRIRLCLSEWPGPAIDTAGPHGHDPAPMRFTRRFAMSCGLVALAGVLAGAQNPRDRHNTGRESFAMRVLSSGLGNPWEVTWGPDGFLWVTERTSFKVTRIDPRDGT